MQLFGTEWCNFRARVRENRCLNTSRKTRGNAEYSWTCAVIWRRHLWTRPAENYWKNELHSKTIKPKYVSVQYLCARISIFFTPSTIITRTLYTYTLLNDSKTRTFLIYTRTVQYALDSNDIVIASSSLNRRVFCIIRRSCIVLSCFFTYDIFSKKTKRYLFHARSFRIRLVKIK